MMGQRQDAVRKIAADLLSRKKVDAFLGYARGSLPMRERPVLVREPHQVSTLVWSGFCVGNLAKYLRKTSGRVGIVAQGCVSRNIVGLIRERQVERDQVFVLGMPCLGMLDRQKIQAAVQGRGIMAVDDDGGPEIVVRGADFEQSLVRAHMRRDNCMTCMHRNPVLYDELAADPGEETGGGDLDAVAAPWEKLESAKRYEAFSRLVGQCVRCYACRDVCPLCYCPQCFVDESRPQWCGKGRSDPDVQTFHLLRALHCAGRCTDCGACESACPMGIKMRRLTTMLEKDVRRLFNHEAGLDPAAAQPLTVYNPNDPQDFLTAGK